MLYFISWQQYVVAILLITAAWYAYVGLKYYQPELRGLLRLKTAGTLPPVAAAPLHAVIGGIRSDTASAKPDELIFSTAGPDDISDATLPKGPADDLLAEAILLAGAAATKADFLSLLQVLLDKYELYRDEISLPALSAQLLQLPLSFTTQELDLQWPAENYN